MCAYLCVCVVNHPNNLYLFPVGAEDDAPVLFRDQALSILGQAERPVNLIMSGLCKPTPLPGHSRWWRSVVPPPPPPKSIWTCRIFNNIIMLCFWQRTVYKVRFTNYIFSIILLKVHKVMTESKASMCRRERQYILSIFCRTHKPFFHFSL